MKKITVIALLLAAALGTQARNGSGKPAYKDASRPVEERVSDPSIPQAGDLLRLSGT